MFQTKKEKELAEKVASLEARIADLEKTLKSRIEALEKGYSPIFDYFLEEKKGELPMGKNRFAPKHQLHPNLDYEVQ